MPVTTAQRYVHPLQQWMDSLGRPLNGGLLYFYQTGTDTPLATYSDAERTVPNDNPVEADEGGVWPDIFLADQLYKVILKNSDGVEVWTADPVSPFIDDDDVVTSYYDFPVFIQGLPEDGELYPIFNAVRDVTLPAGLTGSIFTCDLTPTSTAVFTLYKNAGSIGTISFATNGTPTVTFPSNTAFAAGDQFLMTAPTPQDSTLAHVAFTFVFTIG